MKKVISFVAALILIIGCLPLSAAAASSDATVRILFTHDMHDNAAAHYAASDGKIIKIGGYTYLSSLIKNERTASTVVVDAGDYSMGTVMQTVFSSVSPELRLLGAMGYDATTFGNHEFDYGQNTLAKSLVSAKKSGDRLPAILVSNLTAETSPGSSELSKALKTYGAAQYTVLERGGVKIGLFGLLGKNARSSILDAPDCDDMVKSAENAVQALQKAGAGIIVCLSHGGTSTKGSSEDENLAKKVPGIDVIVSGHTHTVLSKPITVGNTLIVSCGQYAEHLGELDVQKSGDRWRLKNYRLIDVTSAAGADPVVEKKIGVFMNRVNTDYLSKFGYSADTVVAKADFNFLSTLSYANNHYNESMGTLVGDAEKYGIQKAEGEKYEYVDVAVVSDASMRAGLVAGKITAADCFNTRSLGVASDGTPGEPVVACYLYGYELLNLAELDVSAAQFSPAIQLYMAGLQYEYDPHRVLMNRVTKAWVLDRSGKRQELQKDKLYRVSTCLYNLKMFSKLASYSAGLLSLTPKNRDGSKIEDLSKAIARDSSGEDLREWVQIAQYMASFPKDADGVSVISTKYRDHTSQRTENDSRALSAVLSSPNKIGVLLCLIPVILIGLVVLIVVLSVKGHKRRRRKKLQKKLSEEKVPETVH